MALSDVATAQLMESFRAGGGAELVRDAVRLVLGELIEAEATRPVGAGRHERSESRTNERNGHRARLLATQAGDAGAEDPQAVPRQLHAVGDRASATQFPSVPA